MMNSIIPINNITLLFYFVVQGEEGRGASYNMRGACPTRVVVVVVVSILLATPSSSSSSKSPFFEEINVDIAVYPDNDRRRLSFFGSILLNSSTVKDVLKKLSTKTYKYSLKQTVEGKWQDKNTWYQGVIVKVHEDGKYDIRYAGGDFESEVPANRIRCFGTCPLS